MDALKTCQIQRHAVLFRDGTVATLPVYVYTGACLVGQPTAYTCRDDQFVWLTPGESVEWVEA